ncbi:MAG: CPBP family intramembrane metalloprotease [Erysipelotrichaceae bacterium]|nr:CPBP family intramembrane metalloprotease [Erysipelotrichaceae bacterium]
MDLEIKKKENGNKVTLEANGVINTETVSVLNDAVEELDFDDIDLTLDFAQLFYITSVGVFEEMAFRAVINDAIIFQFRNKKYVFVLSAIVSSLAFGVAHIIGADLSGTLQIAQAIGKTVQTGVFGLSILFLYWKTRNIWACGIIHGIYDFLLSLCDCFFDVPGKKISYVVSGEAGKYTIIIYVVITLIELFIFWMIYRKIGKKIDYQKIREEW